MAKILIADDNEAVRKALRALLVGHDGLMVCGEAADGLEAVSMAEQLKPDLIILDIAMPVLDGLRAAVEILRSAPDIPVVLYTLHKCEEIDLEGKKAGARMVIAKSGNPEVLLESVLGLLGEKSVPFPAVAEALPNGRTSDATIDRGTNLDGPLEST